MKAKSGSLPPLFKHSRISTAAQENNSEKNNNILIVTREAHQGVIL
jgi:hypothetical protein